MIILFIFVLPHPIFARGICPAPHRPHRPHRAPHFGVQKWSGMDLSGVCMMMECNAVECNGMDRWNAMQWSGMEWMHFGHFGNCWVQIW